MRQSRPAEWSDWRGRNCERSLAKYNPGNLSGTEENHRQDRQSRAGIGTELKKLRGL